MPDLPAAADFATLPTRAERFQAVLEILPLPAFVMDAAGLFPNPALIAFAGWEPGLVGAVDAADLVHPDDRPEWEEARAAFMALPDDSSFEVRLLRHDDAYRWHRIHARPLSPDGHPGGWLGTATDVHDLLEANLALTDQAVDQAQAAEDRLNAVVQRAEAIEQGLRESEERYRTLYNRTPMALHSVDSDARLLDVNDTWLWMFGYQREEVIGRCPSVFMTPASAQKYLTQAWPEMLSAPSRVRVVDYQFVTRGGAVFDGRLSASGEFDAEGRFIRSWSTIADVTAEKRADQELRQAQRLEAVGQLTAGLAHDFNNLLTAILSNLELLALRIPAEDGRIQGLVRGATAAAQRGAALVAQLLAFSRQQRITPEPTDVDQVITGMQTLLKGTIGAAILIDIVPGPGLWPALADTTQLELAIMNLAINARDAMPRGGRLTIRTANVVRSEPMRPEEPAAGAYVAITVADSGDGMPEPVRERIFEPFFTTKAVGKGSGLGLPQVLGMSKQLGGGLVVNSAPDQGTCVTIFLPKADRIPAGGNGSP